MSYFFICCVFIYPCNALFLQCSLFRLHVGFFYIPSICLSHLLPWHPCLHDIHLEEHLKEREREKTEGYKTPLTASAAMVLIIQILYFRPEREQKKRKKNESTRREACWQLLAVFAAMAEWNRLSEGIVALTGGTQRAEQDGSNGMERVCREGKIASVFPSKSVLLRSLAYWWSEETVVAAAPSSVPADREGAFVCSTVNNIGWHRLECDIIVFCFLFFFLLFIETGSNGAGCRGN